MHLREENVSEEEAKMKLYYFCETCGKSFANKSCLKTHQLHVHQKYSEELPCDVCGKFFRTRELLKQHQEREHSECPRFACNTCGQRFGSNYHLKRHEIIHTDEEFPCELCSRRFKRKDGLETHMSTIHAPRNNESNAQTSDHSGNNNLEFSFEKAIKESECLDHTKSFTELVNFESTSTEFYALDSASHHSNTTGQYIEPFEPLDNVNNEEQRRLEDAEKKQMFEQDIISQIENLSQYKSSAMVRYNINVQVSSLKISHLLNPTH